MEVNVVIRMVMLLSQNFRLCTGIFSDNKLSFLFVTALFILFIA